MVGGVVKATPPFAEKNPREEKLEREAGESAAKPRR